MIRHILNTDSSITNFDDDMIQPNAIDLRLDRIWQMHGMFSIDEESKDHRHKNEIFVDDDGYFYLNPGSYEVSFKHIVDISSTEAGFVITRSTLNRNGVFITSGLYDSGYNGSMAACLHVGGGMMRIKPDTRIAQFVLWDTEAVHQYDGDYGLGKAMDQHLRS